jgi:hypothetical protein
MLASLQLTMRKQNHSDTFYLQDGDAINGRPTKQIVNRNFFCRKQDLPGCYPILYLQTHDTTHLEWANFLAAPQPAYVLGRTKHIDWQRFTPR